MEFHQLKSFVAVAEEGNLTRAAERLYASQPAVSAHIKALEEELGLPLFVRTPRGMRLTDMGKGLKLKADSILQAADELRNQANVYREELTGELTVALNTDSSFLRIADLVATLSDSHPGLKLHLFQSTSHAIMKDVRERRVDAGFSFFENDHPEVVSLRLMPMPVRVVAPVAWRTEVADKSLNQLLDMPWIKPHRDCPFMHLLDRIIRESGSTMRDCIGADSEDVIRQLAAAGKGLALLKECDADDLVREGSVIICETVPELSMSINFVHAETRTGDPLMQALLGAIRNVWKGTAV